jgi:CRP/FNR family transcriptional regulator, cyclic AMP receptor protein
MRKVLYILGQLSDSDVGWIGDHGNRLRHPAGTELIRHGQPLDRLFIILDGEVSVRTHKGFELAKVGVGDILGEMSLVDARPPSASAVVVREAYVLELRKDTLLAKLQADTGFAARFYRAIAIFLSERMRSTVGRLGYGEASDEDGLAEDELDPNVLDNVHLAGARFERLLNKSMG